MTDSINPELYKDLLCDQASIRARLDQMDCALKSHHLMLLCLCATVLFLGTLYYNKGRTF